MSVELYEYKKIENPVIILGFPDVGLVGLIASAYLVERLEMEEIGYIDSDKFLPVIPFYNNRFRFPVRLLNKDKFVVIISDIPIPIGLVPSLAKKLIDYAVARNAEKIVMLGGIAVPKRIDVETPQVYGLGLTKEDNDFLEKEGVKLLGDGFIAGIYAPIIKEALKKNLRGFVLLAECYINYPDPGAAASLLSTFSKLFKVEMDLKPLLDQAEELRIKLRELMRRTMDELRYSRKSYEQTLPLLYR